MVTVPSFSSDDDPPQAARPKIETIANEAKILCLNIPRLLVRYAESIAPFRTCPLKGLVLDRLGPIEEFVLVEGTAS